jgi:hypothetical protein
VFVMVFLLWFYNITCFYDNQLFIIIIKLITFFLSFFSP